MEIIQIFLIITSALFWLTSFYFFYKIKYLVASENFNESDVSIIIPARNEEHNIGKLLNSINSQNYSLKEVIVVNDNSRDRTREISLEKDARVIDSESLPPGWTGKTWACFQGARAAKSELFIFLDADTELEKGGLSKIVSTFYNEKQLNNGKKIALSIAPFHKVKHLYEEFSAIFNIIMTGSMNAFTPLKSAEPSGLFGPSLIILREDYFSCGGHEAVREHILENMFLAEILKKQDFKLLCFGGKGTLSFRMYPDGFKNLVNGWSKAFASGAGQIKFTSLLKIILWITGGFFIFIFLINSLAVGEYIAPWAILYFLFAAGLFRMLRMIGNFKMISSILFPIHLIFFNIVFFRSLYLKIFNKRVSWKSRDV